MMATPVKVAFFSLWRKKELEIFHLPSSIRKIIGQEETKIGNAIMSLTDIELAIECLLPASQLEESKNAMIASKKLLLKIEYAMPIQI